MIERVILRVRGEFYCSRFGHIFTALAEQIDESPRHIARDFETPHASCASVVTFV